MVSVNKIENGVARFLDAELVSKMPDGGLQKILAGTAISLLIKKSGNFIKAFQQNPMIQLMDIFDADGNVDIDSMATELKKNFPDVGLRMDFPMIGTVTFHKEDIDKLYSYITE